MPAESIIIFVPESKGRIHPTIEMAGILRPIAPLSSNTKNINSLVLDYRVFDVFGLG